MRICLAHKHTYPGRLNNGYADSFMLDNLAKGLGELGHEVYYRLGGFSEKLPEGVVFTDRVRDDVDILHLQDERIVYASRFPNVPWVSTIHEDHRNFGVGLDETRSAWIHVSETMARLYGSNRFVHHGLDPSEFMYSESKGDYLLFITASLYRAKTKGIDTAFSIAKQSGKKLYVAGIIHPDDNPDEFAAECRAHGATFIGKIAGEKKAEMLAGAKALLFPTQFNEAFGLVVAEALISGTPVLASNKGAISEILSPDTGFICETEEDYLNALDKVSTVQPAACRKHAMENFHYLTMAKAYVKEYEKEIQASRQQVNTI